MNITNNTIDKLNNDTIAFANELTENELVSILTELDDHYHLYSSPLVSDSVYDAIREVLQIINPTNPYLEKIGSIVTRKKQELPFFMPSLDKAKPGTKILNKWLEYNKGPYTLGDKLDGISLALVYNNGKPYKAYTRGDGTYGQDISHHLPYMNIPKNIINKKTFSVRCEFIMEISTFNNKFSKEQGVGEFENARNMAGGVLNTLTENKLVSDFNIIVYEIIDGHYSDKQLSKQYEYLTELGFNVVPHKTMEYLTEHHLISILEDRRQHANTAIDGIVVTQDTPYSRVRVGYPEYAIAFKMNSGDSMVEGVVKDIEWNVSKHNKIIPTIVLHTIRVSDINVTRVTGHNAYFIMNGWRYKDRLDHINDTPKPIGIGSKLLIVRSGEVIPHVEKVIEPSEYPKLPDMQYIISNTGVDFYLDDSIEDYYNEQSEIKRIEHFCKTLNIDGIKEGIIKKLIMNNFSLKDIIHASVMDLMRVEGIQERKATSMIDNIQKSLKTATFVKLATASNLFGEGIGERRLQDVYNNYPDILHIEKTKDEIIDLIIAIDGFQISNATKIAQALPKFKEWLNVMNIKIVEPENIKNNVGDTMEGKKVVFTRVRDTKLSNWIISQGGEVQQSMRKDTTTLITKDNLNTSSKEEKAKKQGIDVITIADFYSKYNIM